MRMSRLHWWWPGEVGTHVIGRDSGTPSPRQGPGQGTHVYPPPWAGKGAHPYKQSENITSYAGGN